jgi:hypothetical protein
VRGPISSLVALALLGAGCTPGFDERPSQVAGLRLLAVRADPAEARPGQKVTYSALLVDGSGERGDAAIDWAYCSEPKPQADLNDVATACFVLQADYLTPLGTGVQVAGALPTNACRQFGPDVPDAKPGEPPGRPADPDPSGGYYQPVRLILPNNGEYVLAAGEARLTCGLPGATSEIFQAFKQGYRPNQNPEIAGVTVVGTSEVPLAPDDGMTPSLTVAPGKEVRLRAAWPACPAAAACGDGICDAGEDLASCVADCKTPKGCGGSERYVSFDPGTQTISQRHEAMVVSFFATGGSFASDRTGQDEGSTVTSAENTWTAPAQAGVVVIWAVLRDDRGGVGWKRYRVKVQ